MRGGNEEVQGHESQTLPVVLMQQPMDEDDEISLFDLWQTLLKRKNLILMVAGVAVAAGLAYALLATPIYKAESFLLPPMEKDVQALNVQALNNGQDLSVQTYTPDKVYTMFIQYLESNAQRRQYFDTQKLVNSLAPHYDPDTSVEQIFKDFNKKLVSKFEKDKAFVRVAFEGPDAKLAAQWVNGFIAQANAATVNTLVQNVKSRLESRKHALLEQIAAKRKMADKLRMDRLAELQDAIGIADKLGLKENLMAGKSVISLNQTNAPLYMNGSRALRAEAALLRARKNNDPFINGLRDLQEELELLNNIHIDSSRITAMQVDQPALVPDHRIKPKRTLIVLLSLLVGLMLGVFAAFFAEFLAKNARQAQ